MQIKTIPQTCHWKQWICEGFGEEKPKNAISLYHNAINPTLGDKHHSPAQVYDKMTHRITY